MFTKPLLFILVFALTLIHMVFLLALPLALFFIPLTYFFGGTALSAHFILFVFASISSIITAMLILDYLFGFTISGMNKRAVPVKKVKGAELVEQAFERVKERFKAPRVKLYIEKDHSVNAYAIASLRKKRITISLGLVNQILGNSTREQALDAFCGVLGHEMSHIIHHDYLAGMLLYINQTAINRVASLLRFTLWLLLKLLFFIPIIGRWMYSLYRLSYRFTQWLLHLFYDWLLMPFYRFLQLMCSRWIEYRCDRDAAHAFGPNGMIHVLTLLGKGSYFTIFATHPANKSRIKKLTSVQRKTKPVSGSWSDFLANMLSLMLITAITLLLVSMVDFEVILRHFPK